MRERKHYLREDVERQAVFVIVEADACVLLPPGKTSGQGTFVKVEKSSRRMSRVWRGGPLGTVSQLARTKDDIIVAALEILRAL